MIDSTLHPLVRLVESIPFIEHYPFDDIEQLDPVVERYFNTYKAQMVRGGRFNMPDMKTHIGRVAAYYEVGNGNYIKKKDKIK